MKYYYFETNNNDYRRFCDLMSTGKFMNTIRPFVFRSSKNGEMYCIHHGLQNGEFAGGYDSDSIYQYAISHSNMREGETLHVISCYGGCIETRNENVIMEYCTPYPVLIGMDENNIIVGVLESDEDIPELISISRSAGVNLTPEDCKANKRV